MRKIAGLFVRRIRQSGIRVFVVLNRTRVQRVSTSFTLNDFVALFGTRTPSNTEPRS